MTDTRFHAEKQAVNNAVEALALRYLAAHPQLADHRLSFIAVCDFDTGDIHLTPAIGDVIEVLRTHEAMDNPMHFIEQPTTRRQQ